MKNVIVVSLALGLLLPGLAVAQEATPLETSRDVIIRFHGNVDGALVRGKGGAVRRNLSIINGVAATIPLAAWDGIARNPNVAYIELDGVAQAVAGKPSTAVSVNQPQVDTWGVTRIGARAAWLAAGSRGAGIKVAVLDTGIGPNADLAVAGGADITRNLPGAALDDNGHGTHCAGTIAALDNGIGVVGVAPDASLYAVKVLDRRGSGAYSVIIAGVEWATANGMDVISMSLGGEVGSQAMHDAIIAARAAGIVVVVAAGNDATDGNNVQYPAAYDEAIAVGATDVNDAIGYFSSHGAWVDVSAPGVGVLSTIPNDLMDTFNGTSMATPHVAGVVALMLGKNGDLSVDAIEVALRETGVDLGAPGWDEYFGHGLVHAPTAVSPPLPAQCDVAVAGVLGPGNAMLGDTFTVFVSVENRGVVDQLIDVALMGETVELTSDPFPLAAGASHTFEFAVTASAAGSLHYVADVTVLGLVTDEVPENNTGWVDVLVSDPATTPVLRVSSITYREVSRNLRVEVTIRDGAGAVAAGATVAIQLLRNGAVIGTGSALTSSSGVAAFQLRNPTAGTYTTVITSVQKAGTIYEPSLNAADPGYTKK